MNKKKKIILSLMLSFSMLASVYYPIEAKFKLGDITKFLSTKPEKENEVSSKKGNEQEKNGEGLSKKGKELLQQGKDLIKKIKNKKENSTKGNEETANKNSTEENIPKEDQVKDQTEIEKKLRTEMSNMFESCLTLNIDDENTNEKDSTRKAIILNAIIDKLKNKNLISDENLKGGKDQLDLNCNLYSMLQNETSPKINLCYKGKNDENVEKYTKKIEEIKSFIQNISISEEEFNNAKKRIKTFLETQKTIIKNNEKEIKQKDTLLNIKGDKNKKEYDATEKEKAIYYSDELKEFINQHDTELRGQIDTKINDSKFDDAFYKDSLKNARTNEIAKLKESINKIGEDTKENSFLWKVKNCEYDKKLENVKVNGMNQEGSKENIPLCGTQKYLNCFKFPPTALVTGYLDALKLDNKKLEEMKKNYEEKLKNYSNEQNDSLKNLAIFEFLAKAEETDKEENKKNKKKDDKNKEETLKKFLTDKEDSEVNKTKFIEEVKNFEIIYYKTLIEHINKKLNNKK